MAGQIISKGPRKWLVRVFAGSKMVEGKRKKQYVSTTVEGTYAAAERKAAELLTTVNAGNYIPPSTQNLGEYLEWWLRDVVGARAEGGTQRSYRDRLRLVIERGGSVKLDCCHTPALQSIINQLASERGWSARTCAYTRTILRMAFNDAIRQGLLRANPASALLIPRRPAPTGDPVESESTVRVWTQEQVITFLDRSQQSPWYPLWHLMLNSGLRPGEASALQWPDLRGADLTVQRALKQDENKKWLVGRPKTSGSVRTITLPLATLGVLRGFRHGLLVGDMWGQVEYRRDANVSVPIIPTMRRAFERDVKAAGLPDIGLYGMRHTHATLLLILGVPVKVVSERLGHTSVQITMDTYMHVLPTMQQDAADKLNVALGG